MNKKDLPVAALQALNRLNVQLEKIAQSQEDLVEKTFNESNLVCYSDIDANSTFKFELKNVELSQETPIFTVELSPSSYINNDLKDSRTVEKQILQQFSNWIGWLGVYERTDLTPEEEFFRKYKEEFYTDFEIIDEDAETTTFELKQQLFLDQYFEYMENKLLPVAKGDIEIQAVVSDVQELRQNLGKETKKKVIKRFSSILAKLRKSSVKLLGEFYTEAKKELFKRMIAGGLDDIMGLLN